MKAKRKFALMLLAGLAFNVGAESDSGQQVYEKLCVHCHAQGPGNAGTQSLQRRGIGDAVLVDRKDLSAVYIKTIVRSGIKQMPSFRLTEISDDELDKLADYLSQHP